MSSAVVEIQGLCHSYMTGTPLETPALNGVSLTINRGELVALAGPTGSGKSTLLQHLNGLYTADRGSVRVLGRDLAAPETNLQKLRRRVALVMQNPDQQVFERYVGDDVSFGPRSAGVSGVELTRRVRQAMEMVGLDFERFRDRPTFALSGGERRKVGLAGVIALEPEILLLDEPTAGLDPEAREEILALISKLREQRVTMVMATHAMEDVAEVANRLVVLDRGKIAADDTVRSIFGRGADLEQLGIALPPPIAVARALNDLGYTVATNILNLDEAETAILAGLDGKRSG